MSKRIYFIFICLVVLLTLTFSTISKKTSNSNLTKITVAEVTHSIFYAPWYVALEEGYFEEVGLDVEVILTPGADKVMASVLSGDAQIGFSGPEGTIYIKEGNEKDYIVNFAALTKRDGQFIFGDCKYKDSFKLTDLYNKSILVGRIGGMPSMVFNYALKNENINKDKINIDYSIEFSALSGAYIGGTGDFVNLFEPNASKLEEEGYGCVLANLGEFAKEVPYTVFNTKLSYFNDNKDIISKFTSAINKGLKYVLENDSKTIAETIKNQFPDNKIDELSKMIQRYKDSDSWWDNTYIEETAFNRLEEIMIYNKELSKGGYFKELVKNDFNE